MNTQTWNYKHTNYELWTTNLQRINQWHWICNRWKRKSEELTWKWTKKNQKPWLVWNLDWPIKIQKVKLKPTNMGAMIERLRNWKQRKYFLLRLREGKENFLTKIERWNRNEANSVCRVRSREKKKERTLLVRKEGLWKSKKEMIFFFLCGSFKNLQHLWGV